LPERFFFTLIFSVNCNKCTLMRKVWIKIGT
jgi:hypothetical protein